MQNVQCEKNFGNVFLRHLGESSSYFPNPALDHEGAPPLAIPPLYFSKFSWIMLQNLAQALCNAWDGALCDKNSNSWELLFIVMESFVLNMTRLLRSDPEMIR